MEPYSKLIREETESRWRKYGPGGWVRAC